MSPLRSLGGRAARAALPPLVAAAVDTCLTHRAVGIGTAIEQLSGSLFVTL